MLGASIMLQYQQASISVEFPNSSLVDRARPDGFILQINIEETSGASKPINQCYRTCQCYNFTIPRPPDPAPRPGNPQL